MERPLISVIVPVYKVEAYLDRCVKSIVSQSYENLEILLVDDGSPDRCGAMCDAWARRDSRIRVIHKENGGAADARNTGMDCCQGQYVTFVDSDDYLAPEMIEQLYNALFCGNGKMSMCNTNCLNSNCEPEPSGNYLIVDQGVYSARELLPRIYQAWGWLYVVPWNKLFHRDILTHIRYPVGKGNEDEFVCAQLIWEAQTICTTSYAGYFYLQERAGSVMKSWSSLQRLDYFEALLIRYRFYQQIGQTVLLHETRSRVFKALEHYYWGEKNADPHYDQKMSWLRQEYNALTGLPAKEWVKWKVFQISPKLEKLLVGAVRKHGN